MRKDRVAFDAYVRELRRRLPEATVEEFPAFAGAHFAVRVATEDDVEAWERAMEIATELSIEWRERYGVSILGSFDTRRVPATA